MEKSKKRTCELENKTQMNKEEELKLKKAVEDIIWMAIRYADGRSTYAPGMVRDSVKTFKEIWDDFELKEDKTIEPPTENDLKNSISFGEDYLYDLVNKKKDE